MTIIEALILSIVEGLTEFLPISSTGHLALASSLLGIPQTEFVKSFEIAIQLGAIAAVLTMYGRSRLFAAGMPLRLAVAFAPTAAVGLVLYPLIKAQLIGNVAVTLWALLIGGIALILLEWYLERRKRQSPQAEKQIEQLTTKQFFLIGICQSLAVVPGVSRAAATIIGGRLLGLSRLAAVEFSFLLALPTMAAATGLDIVKSGWQFAGFEWVLLAVGCAGAYVSALIAIRFLLRYIQTRSFVAFGIYRILLAGIWLLFLLS
jgi:undecaprenyl-diphosphatase